MEKMYKRLALADKLTSQSGKNAYAVNADAHERTKNISGTNDAAENKFATADYVMRTFRNLTTFNAAGIIQQRN